MIEEYLEVELDILAAKYYLFRATSTAGFVSPILVAFFLRRGITYTQLGILGSILTGTMLLGEIPTGYIADRTGRRNSLILASLLGIVSVLWFGVSYDFAGFGVAYAIWGLGLSFRSGTTSAWLYDRLTEQSREDDYTRISGRGNAFGHGMTAITSVLGGVLAGINWLFPFLAAAASLGLSILVLFTFEEPSVTSQNDDGDETVLSVLPLFRQYLTSPKLRVFLFYVALFMGLLSVTKEYIQPISLDVGVRVNQLGILYAGFSVASTLSGFYVDSITRYLSHKQWFKVVPPLATLSFVAMVVEPTLALIVFFGVYVLNTVSVPFRNQYLNDNFPSARRGTLLSGVSMITSVASIGLGISAGVIADMYSPTMMLALYGSGFTSVAVIILGVQHVSSSNVRLFGTKG